jgi:hypothetical protein
MTDRPAPAAPRSQHPIRQVTLISLDARSCPPAAAAPSPTGSSAGSGGRARRRSLQGTSSGLNHLSIVVVADLQMDRHLEPDRPVSDLKRDADLRIRPVARGGFDARHFDLELAHRLVLLAALDPSPVRRLARWTTYADSRLVGSGAMVMPWALRRRPCGCAGSGRFAPSPRPPATGHPPSWRRRTALSAAWSEACSTA